MISAGKMHHTCKKLTMRLYKIKYDVLMCRNNEKKIRMLFNIFFYSLSEERIVPRNKENSCGAICTFHKYIYVVS
jgi:hypothetical protein